MKYKKYINYILIFFAIEIFFFSLMVHRTFGQLEWSQIQTTIATGIWYSFEFSNSLAFFKWLIILPIFTFVFFLLNVIFKNKYNLLLYINSIGLISVCLLSFKIAIISPSGDHWDKRIMTEYVKPEILNAKQIDSEKLNLIWIFVESLEKRYRIDSVLKNLHYSTQFMQEFTIDPLVQKYTIGSIMSQRCAVPLNLGFMSGNEIVTTAFNNTNCIDDLLKQNNYHSTFIVGHDARFSGLGDYFKSHADSEVYDMAYFKIHNISSFDSDDHYSDEFVFDFALKKLTLPQKKPFSMTILTLDNHMPYGIPSEACKRVYGQNLSAVLTCNSDNLAKFIDKLKQNDILKDTALVVVGDHPFMGTHKIFDDKRTVFAKIYTPLNTKLKTNTLTPFDMLPTVLSAVGFQVGSGALGLGFSRYETIFEPKPDWTMLLRDGFRGTPPDNYISLHKK